MVMKMFELRQSNKLFAKILVAFFVVALALVIALAPPLETAAYASATNYVCEAVGVIVGAVAGSLTTSAVLQAAGITSVAILSGSVSALLAFLAAMGIGMAVSALITTLTSEKSLDSFGVTFWKALKDSWDDKKQKVICSAAVFQMIVSKIRQALGIESKDDNLGSSSTFKAVTAVPTMSDFDMPEVDGTSKTFDSIVCGDVVGDIKSIYFYGKTQFRTSDIYAFGSSSYFYDFSCETDNRPMVALTPCVNNNAKEMYLCTCGMSYYEIGSLNVNYRVYYKKYILFTGSNGDEVNIISDDARHLYCIQPDGKIIKPESIANFIYLILYKNCNAVSVKVSDDVLSGNDNVLDVSDSDAAKVNTFDNGDLKNLGKTKSLDATYTEKNDRTKGIYDSIKSTGKSTEVKGEVTLDSVGISDATTIDAVGSLDVSDVIGVVGVGASDISVPDTATGDDVPVDVPTDNVIPFDVGPKLIKFSAEGIADKFPFCLPKFLKEQLNIMVADPKEPKFSIPFEVKSAKLKGDIDLDLTMGGKAKTITNITDFFLCAALLVGLVFATKKLEF